MAAVLDDDEVLAFGATLVVGLVCFLVLRLAFGHATPDVDL